MKKSGRFADHSLTAALTTTLIGYKSMDKTKKQGKEEYVIEIECIHEQRNVNLGTRFCFKGDIAKCDSCPFKEPGEIRSILTYTTGNL